MSDISSWSNTASGNTSAAPNGFPEGMAPSGVNDAAREVMAAVRRFCDDDGWFYRGHTCTYISGTSFSIPTNLTTIYHIGRRVRAVGAATGTIYGTISNSAYTSVTTITVAWDSGSLSNEAITVSLGFLSVDNPSFQSLLTIDYIGKYASLAAAVTAIGSTATLLIIDSVVNITDHQTVPTNITLWPTGVGAFNISATKLLTINGGLKAEPHRQVFIGDGWVKFGYGGIGTIYGGWFGMVADYNWATYAGTDNTLALQKTVNTAMMSNLTNSFNAASRIKIPAGSYKFSDEVGIGNSAQDDLVAAGYIGSYNYAPLIIEGDAHGQVYGGGTRLLRADGGFLFMVGGEYVLATNVFTSGGVQPGPLNFRDLTISYAGDNTSLAAIKAGKPKGIGGNLQYAQIQRCLFQFLYTGLDTRFEYPASGDAGEFDYATIKDTNFNNIVHRGALLNAPDATVLDNVHFYTPGSFIVDDDFGPGNAEIVTACGLASYGGSPVLLGCGFNGYGTGTYDRGLWVFDPYTFTAISIHSECTRFLYASASQYAGVLAEHSHSVLNFIGGSIFSLTSTAIQVLAAGKIRFDGVQFRPNVADTDIFHVSAADFKVNNCKFWLPTNAEFTPTNNGTSKMSIDGVMKVTTAERLALPSLWESLWVYDTTLHTFCFYNGTTWRIL